MRRGDLLRARCWFVHATAFFPPERGPKATMLPVTNVSLSHAKLTGISNFLCAVCIAAMQHRPLPNRPVNLYIITRDCRAIQPGGTTRMIRIMYRTIANEKVVLSRAKMPEATARKTGFGALAVFAKHVVNSVRHTLERTSIARELSALNDRELADIGLRRGDIAAVAELSVTAPRPRPGGRVRRAWSMTCWSPRSPCGTSAAPPTARSTRSTTGCSPTSASPGRRSATW